MGDKSSNFSKRLASSMGSLMGIKVFSSMDKVSVGTNTGVGDPSRTDGVISIPEVGMLGGKVGVGVSNVWVGRMITGEGVGDARVTGTGLL